MKKRVFSSLALLLFTAVLPAVATRAARDRYVPNEIIVKLRGPAADAVENQPKLRDSAATLKVPGDLDRLNTKYGARQIKPLLKNFRRRQQQLESLREKDRGLLTQKEERVLERLKRAPAGAKIPDLDRIYKIELDRGSGESLQEALEAYRDNPNVEYAELNYIVSADSTPNDPLYPDQWSLSRIDAPLAWDIYTGSSQTIVAVVDTGVDYNHRDLRDNMWVNEAELDGVVGVDDDGNGYLDDIHGYNFVYNDSYPMDDYGHGTHCCGIIAAEGDNGLDIAGVCWNARIMALKFMGSFGEGSISDAALAFYYAVANGADVISNSWSTRDESKLLEDVIDYAHSQGVIVVASAGNDGSDVAQYPAAYRNVISVAATDSNDVRWPHSNHGDWVDIAAPGVHVLSLRAKGTSAGTPYDEHTTYLSGTSTACPHIAGACALLLSANPLMRPDQLCSILTRTADPIESGTCLSNGRVNLSEAMHAVVPSRGYIQFDHDHYADSSTVGMLLADGDLKGKGGQEATIVTSGGDLEKVLLSERTPAFGVYTGTIPTGSGEPNTQDGTIQVASDEVITVIYFDADDGTGNPGAAMDTAVTDCEVPTLLHVQVETRGRVACITLVTNEPTRARLRWGLAPGGLYTLVEEDVVTAINHTIQLQPLSIGAEYRFVIDMVDAVGNKATADNNGLGYSFTTPAEFLGFCVPGVYPTIQAAIDDALDGDTVWVADGKYTGEGNFDIDFKGKAITVRSENGPESCTIDCQYKGRGFDFHSGEGENAVLDGFTITRGFAGGFGGGILCTASNPKITNCIITENLAGQYGGGMCNAYNSAPILTHCTFSENAAESRPSPVGYGGAMCNLINSSPTLSNCTFSDNLAHHSGGGMYNYQGSSPTLTQCTFSANSAEHGGGMYTCYQSDPSLINCVFSRNSAESGGAMKSCEAITTLINCTLSGNSAKVGGGIWNTWRGSSKLTNCILWANSDRNGMVESSQIEDTHGSIASVVNYCCIQDWTGTLGGIGNFQADPLFADPNAGDYHLRSGGWRWDTERQRWHYDEATSHCIDVGNPGSPLDGELLSVPDDPANMWAVNLRINMGAYGGTAEASMPPYDWTRLGDINNDGNVNIRDFAIQLQYWQRAGDTQPGDLNRDGLVDMVDLALLTEDWVKYIKPPVVNIIKPRNDSTFVMRPVEVEIEAEAWDANGSVVKVEFFVSGHKISEDNDGSDGWTAYWNEYARGSYSLTARATDNGGATATSPPVKITVIPPR